MKTEELAFDYSMKAYVRATEKAVDLIDRLCGSDIASQERTKALVSVRQHLVAVRDELSFSFSGPVVAVEGTSPQPALTLFNEGFRSAAKAFLSVQEQRYSSGCEPSVSNEFRESRWLLRDFIAFVFAINRGLSMSAARSRLQTMADYDAAGEVFLDSLHEFEMDTEHVTKQELAACLVIVEGGGSPGAGAIDKHLRKYGKETIAVPGVQGGQTTLFHRREALAVCISHPKWKKKTS